jgi:hypothetical protein
MNVITLYHGSNVIFDEVSLAKSRDRRDFGRGFYTTTLRTQAENWAKSLFERYRGEGKYLYVFDFVWDDVLHIKEFDSLSLDWLEMVRENRINGGTSHSYDIVKGPVANDNTMPTIALYVDGTLNADATLAQLAYFKANDQVSIHTERALKMLRLVERVAV